MLAVNHYVKDGAETLFIANQDINRRRDVHVRAKWPAGNAELWDPMQGTVERPMVEDGCIKLSLEPCQSAFLVWPKAMTRRTVPARVEHPVGTDVPVAVKTSVVPVERGGEAKESFGDMFEYARWIWHPVDPRAKGSVMFRTRIDAPAAEVAQITFACDNSAVVRVNGREVARQNAGAAPDYYGWRTPVQAAFDLKAGRNDIEVLADNAAPDVAGFIAAVKWSMGLVLTGEQDSRWTVARSGEAAVPPRAICNYGRKPWGTLGRPRETRSPFAESVSTECSFSLSGLKDCERVYFVCDGTDGEKSAAITVNGSFAGGFIGAPYRLDVTRFVKAGYNTLESRPFRMKNPRIVVVK